MLTRAENLKRLAILLVVHAAVVAPAIAFAHATPVGDTAAQEWSAERAPCKDARSGMVS